MLKFFRRIRRTLLEEGNLRKYLFYAIGEVLLVMIGILLALQVNTWNEARKDRIVERAYLKGIQDDLKLDTAFLHALLPQAELRLNQYKTVDTDFELPSEILKPTADTIFRLSNFRHPVKSFRPTIGTYKALISEGRSNLIRNRKLFSNIQQIYEVKMDQLKEAGVEQDARAYKVMWEQRVAFRNKNLFTPSQINDTGLIADLDFLHLSIRFYSRLMGELEKEITEVIDLIEEEFNN